MSTVRNVEATVLAALPFTVDLGTMLTVLSIMWVLVRLAQEPLVQKFLAQLAPALAVFETFTALTQRTLAALAFWRKPPDDEPPKNG